ncbi:hypothetical protein [Flectobacillus longus]|uniref:hypothetical protein n=1 Tax=Flectobacillus longus TaxID=2984207 RepID=UPI0024B6B8E9|nr:hypothetical protein [Flectobacillus longus]MDI9880332.1 hypothetical protein [Flectobacillus longus]
MDFIPVGLEIVISAIGKHQQFVLDVQALGLNFNIAFVQEWTINEFTAYVNTRTL